MGSKNFSANNSRQLQQIFEGLTKNNVRLCLESIFDQEGVQPQNVFVAYDSAYNEIGELSMLFDAQPVPINSTESYDGLLFFKFCHSLRTF